MDKDEKIIFAQFVIELFIHLAVGLTVAVITHILDYQAAAIFILVLICIPAVILFVVRCWYLFTN